MLGKHCPVTFICFPEWVCRFEQQICLKIISNYVNLTIWHFFQCREILLKCVWEIREFHFLISVETLRVPSPQTNPGNKKAGNDPVTMTIS